jgi:hypothetical protein
MTLEELLTEWENDSRIDDNHLDNASVETAKLHSKYLRILTTTRLKKAKLEGELCSLRKLKTKYYRGEMSRQELAEQGWEQYQFNKPLRTEMDEFLKGDDDIALIITRQEYVSTMLYAIESIMTQIKSRDFQISNSIKWKVFLAGA